MKLAALAEHYDVSLSWLTPKAITDFLETNTSGEVQLPLALALRKGADRMTSKKYRTLSLFSGAMGLDLGIEGTGRFELLACVEKEPAFCATIRRNRDASRLPKDLRVYEGDICDISPEQIMKECGLKPGELDLLVGGPPC